MKKIRRTLAAVTVGMMCLVETPTVGIAPLISMTASAEDELMYGVVIYEVEMS